MANFNSYVKLPEGTVPSESVELASFPGAPTFDFEARRHDDSVWNLILASCSSAAPSHITLWLFSVAIENDH